MDSKFPYSEKVMDHFMNPRNMGDMENPSAIGNVGNPTCGDVMRLYLKIEGDIIVDAKFKTFGCGAAIASSSMLTELLKGKKIDRKELQEALSTYYEMMGWDQKGKPLRGKLEELGLEWVNSA